MPSIRKVLCWWKKMTSVKILVREDYKYNWIHIVNLDSRAFSVKFRIQIKPNRRTPNAEVASSLNIVMFLFFYTSETGLSNKLYVSWQSNLTFPLVLRSLKNWDMRSINVGFANGAEIGLKIDENFKESDMVTLLKNYADQNGVGGNILTSKFWCTGQYWSLIFFSVSIL